ncbi:membrane bound O-acyl transferase family-domain-containing protein [Fimbriimonas ginsengisoli]|nr:membrane bound O-acyl transferase family-domain-containing protein [Fimbriimonas ginsengisoli]
MGTLGFVAAWTLAWLIAALIPGLPRTPRARGFAWLFPAAGIALLIVFRSEPAGLRLLASSLLFLYLMKGAVTLQSPPVRLRLLDHLLFVTIWPGMDAESFAQRAPAPNGTGARFGRGLTLMLFGIAVAGATAIFLPWIPPMAVGWLGIAGILLTVHFGASEVMTSALWMLGRPVRPLFDRPYASRTLSEFWTRRWNLAFVEMDRRLFLPALVGRIGLRRAIFAVFLISGLLHEMAISYSVGAGWGGPMLYFAIQCLGLGLERRWRVRSKLWTLAWIFVPLPLLFHTPFRNQLIVPLFVWLHHQITSQPLTWYVGALLWSLGAMQLCVLLASSQVPKKLNWSEELPRLSPFNRKLMWTYGIFIVTTIVSFAILTLVLHDSFLRGETAAIGLASFMCGFWALRLVFDAFYFRSEDWPAGEEFKVGHALLNALFAYLVLGYGAVAAYGWLARR